MELFRENEYERATLAGEHVYTEHVYEPATRQDIDAWLKERGMVAVCEVELSALSKPLGGLSRNYAVHVSKRGGDGDTSDLMSFAKTLTIDVKAEGE